VERTHGDYVGERRQKYILIDFVPNCKKKNKKRKKEKLELQLHIYYEP